MIAPSPGRFKPLRCGLVELFLYEAQEFPFRDGRLLLRGDNGSGKSKVLALTLPLLLDASLLPARMEPDGDPHKRMAWNLLMGDAYDERTGYSWVEFGRVDEDGTERFVTVGLGVKAVRQKGIVRQWWFLTDMRVGEELHLVDRTRTARTRERLIEVIGERGTVFDTAERYRRAVDEALFGLHDRYEALVDLLVHLRQPQLSKRPDEEHLNTALTQALPPMVESLVDTVAQSYQALEDEERAVARLASTASAVRAFTAEYERYARVAAARATVAPRRAQSGYEEQRRQARAAQALRDEAREALALADAALADARTRLADRQGAQGALNSRLASDEMRQYAAARELAEAKRMTATAAQAALSGATTAHGSAQSALQHAREDAERESAVAAREREAVAARAAVAGVTLPLDDLAELARGSEEEIERRRRHLAHLGTLLGERDDADRRRAGTASAVDDAATRLEAADARMRAAHDAASGAAAAWHERAREHLQNAGLLRGEGRDEAIEEAADWAAVPTDTPNPLAQWADAVSRARDAEMEDERIAQENELRRLAPLMEGLDAELASLSAGGVRRPPVPRTRTQQRDDAQGAAFWECVDVRPGVPIEDPAGIEAALEAGGVLDAWVDRDGLARAVDGDVLLRPAPLAGPTLADVLVPVAVREVSAHAIEQLLRSIALADDPIAGAVAVSRRGRFALGPLVGSWEKPSAQYLGATAREAARLARLAEATSEREALVQARQSWRTRGEEIRASRVRLAAEREGLPSDAPVRASSQAAAAAGAFRGEADEALAQRKVALAAATAQHADASAAVEETAALYAIEVALLAPVRAALESLREHVERLLDANRRVEQVQARVRDYLTAANEAASARDGAQANAARAGEEAAAALQHRDTLESTIGKEAEEIRAQLDAVVSEISAIESGLGEIARRREHASNALAVANDRIEGAAAAVEAAASAREAAAEEFLRFARTGLLTLAAPGIEMPDPTSAWSPDPAVRLARRTLDVLGGQDVNDDAWDAAVSRLRRAFEILQGALSTQGRQSAWDPHHGVTVVTIQHGSGFVAPELLAADLDQELADRERLLTEKERAILETHLIDEVGAQLHERVREAMQQVNRMNTELARRPTRSGLQLRILWEPADGELDKEGRALLQQSSAAWSPSERESIGEYLRSRISTARADDPDGSWHERLARAFDYRSWNRFTVQLHQNGAWRAASGPASGGERVLAASVPLFAAAASHYASASNPHAPRLILLDEAFAGVDDRSRASYLGLLTEFDLDVVMTSEREWATYPEIPGIAIANLFRLPGTDAVHVEYWTWDGATRKRLDEPGMSAIEPAPAAEAGDDALMLDFGDLG